MTFARGQPAAAEQEKEKGRSKVISNSFRFDAINANPLHQAADSSSSTTQVSLHHHRSFIVSTCCFLLFFKTKIDYKP